MERLINNSRHLPAERQLLGAGEIADFLQRRWKTIAVVATVVFALSIIAIYAVTPQYSSTAELLLETPRENVLGTESMTAGMVLSSSVVESQLAVMKSKSLLRRVALEQKLIEYPEFGGKAPPSWSEAAVRAVRDAMKAILGDEDKPKPRDSLSIAVAKLWDATEVSRVGQSNVIRISVTGGQPAQVRSLANSIPEAYLSEQLEARFESARRSSDWLNERQGVLQTEVAKSEAAVEAFRIKNNLVATSSGSLTEQQMAELNTALIKARAETAAKRASMEQIDKLIASGGDVQSSTDVLRSGIVSDLRAKMTALTSQESESRSRYGERHPDVLKLRAELRVVQAQLKGEVEQAIAGLRSDFESAEWRETSFAASLAAASNQTGADNQVAVQLRELERVAAANKQIYESFLSRAKIAEEEKTLPTTEARIISPAMQADSPVFPRTKLIAALGLVLGLCLGIAVAVLKEMLRHGFIAQRQVQEALDIPVLASIPRMKAWELRGDRLTLRLLTDLSQQPFSRYTEAIRGLRFGIDAASPTNAAEFPRVIQVTSTMPAEGKTTLAVSLARSASVAGENVLLIDADLRLGAASRIFGRQADAGLVDVLTAAADVHDCIYYDEQSGVYLLPSGTRAQNPPAMLDSERMQMLIHYAREKFDRVIVDSPPVAVAIDSAVLSRRADFVLFAVKWSDTAREAVSQAVSQLRCPAHMVGIVLTMVDERKLPRYGRYLSIDGKVAERYGYGRADSNSLDWLGRAAGRNS